MVENMGKIVGKIFITIIIFFIITVDARVSMEIRSENGTRDRVVLGQPFVLDVVVDDVYGSVQAPVIKGLEQFNVQRTGVAMTSINGKSNTRYSYQVRIDTLGSYIIGPAVVHHQQQEFISNTVNITVVKDMVPTQSSVKNNAHHETKVFLRLMVNAESVVVGQKIECILRFYYQDHSLGLNKIGIPELPDFEVKNMGDIENGIADHNGVQYRYAQWRWDIYPKKSGEFIIPAYHIDYEIPVKDNRLLGGFFMFMNNRAERKRVYSNAVTIDVAPLPDYKGHVDAIGVFERMTAYIKPSMAKEGEGMELVVEIEGTGNLDALAVPKLIMPEALKYYDSQCSIIAPKNSDELPKKRFEYIVQGMRHGEWEIPEQSFTYFDTEKHCYAQLRTSPLIVSIMPGAINSKQNSIHENENEGIADISVATVSPDGIGYINTVGRWHPVQEYKPLQWWLFFLLLLLPCAYGLYPIIVGKFFLLHNRLSWSRKWSAYKKARKKIKQISVFEDASRVYVVFVHLFSMCGYPYSLQDLSDILRKCGCSSEMIYEWNSFLNDITYAAYAKIDTINNTDTLCRKAMQWIDRLEKIL